MKKVILSVLLLSVFYGQHLYAAPIDDVNAADEKYKTIK